jgi:protein involved in temperature-dependent protein secretion
MADPKTDAEEAVRAGDPREALKRLTEAVRAKPADGPLRVFLAQLLCVLGQWERAAHPAQCGGRHGRARDPDARDRSATRSAAS